MTDQISKFIDYMREMDCGPSDPDDIQGDDERRYYRIEGDKPGVKKGSYVLRIDPCGFAVGGFMTMRDGQWHSWHSKSSRKASEEEKASWQEKRDKARREQEEADAALRQRAAKQARSMWDDASEQGVQQHAYYQRKGMSCGGLRVWMDTDRFEEALLVPVTKQGQLVGMQKIYADGEKLFVYGTDMRGGYMWLGEPETASTVAVVEGLATGDKVHAATGWPVCVAFNAGNLKAVTAEVHKLGKRVVICGDNDMWTFAHKHRKHMPDTLPTHDDPQWNEWRDAGWLRNAGREAAEQAAASTGGAQVFLPPTGGDWDDYARANGLDVMRDLLVVPVEAVQEWEPAQPDYDDYAEVGPSYDDTLTPRERLRDLVNPLGYEGTTMYFLPKRGGQILEFQAGALQSHLNLLLMATRMEYGAAMGIDTDKNSDLTDRIPETLIALCMERGIYEPTRVFGSGAWMDKGKFRLNMGDSVYCGEGDFRQHSDVDGSGFYVKSGARYDFDCEPLKNAEAYQFREICDRLTWKRGINGVLLAGWCVIAPVGGALSWRPHIFLTGEAGSGKSTVMEKIVMEMIGSVSLKMDGGSTEAGLRNEIKSNCLPVVMDEFESERKRDAENVQNILTWARKASSGGVMTNANGSFRSQSCVIFSAINPTLTQRADMDRVTLLELVANKAHDAAEQYNDLLDKIHNTITPEYAKRMIRRTVKNIDALLSNCKTFSTEAARILGSQRAGDQYGPMLAGAYMLNSTRKLTAVEAREWCEQQDWTWHYENVDGSDSERLVQRILTSMVDHTSLDRTGKMSVVDLIEKARNEDNGFRDAVKTLGRIGIKVSGDRLMVANKNSRLSDLLAGTPWVEYRPSLSRYPNAESCDNPQWFAGGTRSQRCISLPLSGILDDAIETPHNGYTMEDFE